MRKLMIILLLAILALGGFGLYYRAKIWNYISREHYSPEKEKVDIEKAEGLLKDGQPKDALDVIQVYQERFAQKDDVAKKWVDLFMKASLGAQEPENIYFLYQQFPHSIDGNEEGALIVSDLLVKTGKINDYTHLRDSWKGKETRPAAWFVLDADKILVDGDRQAAIKLLNSQSFEGSDDVPRLVRLAFLNVEENPRMSWEYLTEAYQKDPKNVIVRSYRARLLEAVNKSALALSEYVAAASIEPKNAALRDQLAEFYRRHGRYKLALKVWEDALTFQNSDSLWVKEWFWGRMATPVDFKWDEKKVPAGELQPFVDYLLSLTAEQYWDSSKFEALSNANQYLQTQQSSFWLRLVQNLKDSQDDKAWELIQYNSFNPVSWSPELETMIKRILAYRKTGSLILAEEAKKPHGLDEEDTPKQTLTPAATTPIATQTPTKGPDDQEGAAATQTTSQHPFYIQLQNLAKSEQKGEKDVVPESLKKLLTGKDAFTAAFLAAGWLEAALALNSAKVLPDDSPEWFSYGLTQAIRFNRGTMPALEFATKQKPTPALNMLIGELLISSGSPDAGLEKLLALANQNDDIGFRAAWLVTLLYIERQQFDKAIEMIQSHPALAQNVIGREALARIALLQGKIEEADQQYSALEAESWEAKSYLARKAYEDKNFKRAKELTEALLIEFPNNILIQKNYQKILDDEKGGNTATPQQMQPVTPSTPDVKGTPKL